MLSGGAQMVTATVVVLTRVCALASTIVDMQRVTVATVAIIRTKNIYTKMGTTAVILFALVHVFACLLVISIQRIARWTTAPETSLKVLAKMAAAAVLHVTLVNVQTSGLIFGQFQARRTGTVEPTNCVHTVMGAGPRFALTLINIDTSEIVGRQLMTLWTMTLKSAQ